MVYDILTRVHMLGWLGLLAGGLGIVTGITRSMGTVVIRGLNISTSRIARDTDFAGSLNTSSLSVMRLVVSFRGGFSVRVPSSSTNSGVSAMNSTVGCVRSGIGTWFICIRVGGGK